MSKPDPAKPDGHLSLLGEKKYFSITFLAEMWDCSEKSVQRLIDCGDLEAVDIAPTPSAKALQRVTRESLIELLGKRKAGRYVRKSKPKRKTRA